MIIKIEKWIFFHTGIVLPRLRNYWNIRSKRIQYMLDKEHNN